MAQLNVKRVVAVGFPIDTTVTTANEAGGTDTYIALANGWYGVPEGLELMTVDPGGKAMCMLEGRRAKRGTRDTLQIMTVDQIRISV